jgi:negative regulator of replication initiation
MKKIILGVDDETYQYLQRKRSEYGSMSFLLRRALQLFRSEELKLRTAPVPAEKTAE